ncbi:hypothetical protein LEN26_018177 [Aphanomyces euteiches]|nr:hypothetical protein LEN26_018177 [Aphanomyces euteiches]KAH9112754.1 hypothetical protein AeMF1_012970 [Aphanomyces euteiches]KAH9167094.1 hypothetical protein AeNC1_018213 [Aphanomyces euteiches]
MKAESAQAKWNEDMDKLLVQEYRQQASKADMIAAGGKALKRKAWNSILHVFNGRNNINNVVKLQSRWKRLKTDYSDYKWLCEHFSGTGFFGLDDDKWNELDSLSRSKTNMLSRFRHGPFIHYEAIGQICGDSMADGSYIRGTDDEPLFETEQSCVETATDDLETSNGLSLDTAIEDSFNLTATQRRAKLINEAHVNARKRKHVNDELRNDIRKTNSETLKAMSATMNAMLEILQRSVKPSESNENSNSS